MAVVDRRDYFLGLHQRLRQFARYSIGRILGTVADTKGSYLFLLDLAQSKRFHRAEINVLVRLLVDKGIMSEGEWTRALERELELAIQDEERYWPECKAAADGRSMIVDVAVAARRCADEQWPP